MEEVEKELLVKHYRTLKQIKFDYMQQLPELDHCSGVWIYGESGCGKSTKARLDYPDYYLKAANKWWDGYSEEDNVILEDLGKEHSVLGHHIKLWADKHDFVAECKGSSIRIRPKVFVVTSQYRIEDIWDDVETVSALKRRFKVIVMDPRGPLPDLYKNKKTD